MMDAILISGGIDSAAVAYWKKPAIGITIDYGQLCAEAEIRAAKQICKEIRMLHETISVDCSSLGSGDLLGSAPLKLAPVPEWWPFRNQLLITLAAMRATALNINMILVGSVKTDATHTDGTQEFFQRINDIVGLQEGHIQIAAPAIGMSSTELVRHSGISKSILAWSHSCHRSNFACGLCRGCKKHRAVMSELYNVAY